jgi:hypothetical protein
VINIWPREALMMGLVCPAGGAGAWSPGASVGMRDSDRILIVPVAANVLRIATINGS